MHANLPKIAKRWEKDYAGGGIARLGFYNGNTVAPFPYQGGTIPFDPSIGNRGVYEFDELNPQKNKERLQELGIYENLYKAPPPQMIGDKGGSMNFMSGSLDAPYGVNPITGMPYQQPRTIADQNRVLGQTFTQRQPAWYNRMFNKAGQGITGLKNQMGNIFSGAKNQGGALVGNIMGALAGIPGLGAILGSIRPDNPYEKFQKQMFSEMGYQGDPNKDPFGKNVRSLFGNYDVIEQADKFAASKLGQKRNFAEVMADGIITQDEIDDYGLDKMGGYQLNRLRTLAAAKKKAQAYQKKIADAQVLKEKQREERKRKDTTPTYKGTPGGNTGSGSFATFDNTGKTYGPHGGSAPSGGVKTGAGRNPWGRKNGGIITLYG